MNLGNHPLISYSLYLIGKYYSDLGDKEITNKYAKESLDMSNHVYEGILLSTASSF